MRTRPDGLPAKPPRSAPFLLARRRRAPRRQVGLRPPATSAERDARREHLLASLWGGLSGGLVGLTDVILAKTLAAPGWQVTLLATLTPAANLTSFWWAGQVEGRRKAGFFLLGGLLGRLPLLALLAVRASGWLILLNFLYAVASALLITAGNAVLQQRYAAADRARWFGWSTSVSALASIVAVQTAGWLLERREGLFPWLFAAAGLAGLVSAWHLFRMEAGREEARGVGAWLGGGWGSLDRRLRPRAGASGPGLRETFAVVQRILRGDPGFVRFERSFMIYGVAFMSLLPVLPLYVVRELRLTYTQLSSTKGIWSQIGLVALSPVLGAVLGRVRPLLFTGRVFLLLALYPFLLLVSAIPGVPDRVSFVYAALFFYSIAMTGVNLSWNLGPMHFAGTRDASAYQGVHVALTGIRGLLAPGLGFLLYQLAGSAAVFALSTGLFLLAGGLMLRQDRQELIRDKPAGAG